MRRGPGERASREPKRDGLGASWRSLKGAGEKGRAELEGNCVLCSFEAFCCEAKERRGICIREGFLFQVRRLWYLVFIEYSLYTSLGSQLL